MNRRAFLATSAASATAVTLNAAAAVTEGPFGETGVPLVAPRYICPRPGPLTLHQVCASLTSRRARGFRSKRPSPLSATPAMSPPLMYRRPWPRKRVSVLAKRRLASAQ